MSYDSSDGFISLGVGESHAWAIPYRGRFGLTASTTFGVVLDGPSVLRKGDASYPLQSGMYFACPGEGELIGGAGLAIPVPGYRALFTVGGPAEREGRLGYVNGATDTLLIAPPRMGDPCLNFLHLPAHCEQVPHTHPSVRVGVVLSGSGHCVTPTGRHALLPGAMFVIEPDTEHAFHPGDEPLRVVAFHPDSDSGPTDRDHPMVNRTMVDGRSVVHRPELLTERGGAS